MKYFENFPQVDYNGRQVTDLTRRNRFLKTVQNNPMLYYPYTVKEGERPEDIALNYYGSTDYTWLVYMSNNIIDPYHQWPLSEEQFEEYLKAKYAEASGKTGNDIIDWTRDEDIEDNIVYYYKEV